MSERLNLKLKQEKVAELSSQLKDYPVVGIVNLHNLPGRQLHEMKRKLLGKATIKMAKKSSIQRALESNENVAKLTEYTTGQPALLLSKTNPFKLYTFMQKNKAKAGAKIGDVLPRDVTVSAGITNVAPGPSIGIFKKFGLETKVTQGKLEVTKDRVVAKAGDVVNSEMLGLFTMLGIQPMEIGLDIVAAYEGGMIYDKNVMAVSEEEYLEMVQKAYTSAFNLAFNAGIYMKENIDTFIAKAVRGAKALQSEAKIDAESSKGEAAPASEEQPSNV